MENLQLDFIQDLIPDEDGNAAILVIIDTFTRFIELYPCKDVTANSAIQAMLNHAGRYGLARIVTSDQGPAFVSHVMEELFKMMGSEHAFTHPYSKQENAIVERANYEVMRHLRNIIFEKNVLSKWSRNLPLVQRIINSSVHKTIGVTPAELLFGNAVHLDRGIFLDYTPGDLSKDIKLSAWTADMLLAQSTVIDIARQNLRARDEVHMRTASENATVYPVGSYVLVEHPENIIRRGPKSKLLPTLKGPLRVVNITNNGNSYSLQNLVTNKAKDYMVKYIHPFTMTNSNEKLTPLDIAITDREDVEIIRAVVQIKGDARYKKKLQLKVLWKNCADDEFTWEPWANVRTNECVIRFLRSHKDKRIRKLVPKNIVIESELNTNSYFF
jgi:hypothetical protein